MNNYEYERIFQIIRGDHSADAMCHTARLDLADGLDVPQVMTRMKTQDARLRRSSVGINSEPLNWRCALDKPGRPGEHSTIATSCVLIGLEDYPFRKARSVEVMKFLLDTDPELAWGRMRFPDNVVPIMPIVIACTRARPDIVKVMTEHHSAEKYLPTHASYEQTPCPGGRVTDLIEQTVRFNKKQRATGDDDETTLANRQKCVEVLKRLHQRRHVKEQSILEDLLAARLNFGASEIDGMCSNLLTYTHCEIPRARHRAGLLGPCPVFLPSTPAATDDNTSSVYYDVDDDLELQSTTSSRRRAWLERFMRGGKDVILALPWTREAWNRRRIVDPRYLKLADA